MGAQLFGYTKKRGHFLVMIFAIAMSAFFVLLPAAVGAQPAADENVADAVTAVDLGLYYGNQTGLGQSSLQDTIARIIRVALSLLGIIAVIVVIAGGVRYMTAGGDADKVAQGRKIIINGAIGLAIILSSYAITQFVINSLLDGTTGSGGLFGQQGNDADAANRARFRAYAGAGHLGKVVQDHYPGRGARNIPRNSQIIVTFREPMDLSTLVVDGNANDILGDCVDGVCDQVNNENILIAPSATFDDGLYLQAVDAVISGEDRTLTLIPQDYLGEPNEQVGYKVRLTSAIKRATGADAFGGLNAQYEWGFTTGGQLDETPPRVVRVSPAEQTTITADRVVQITFSEAMSPVGLDVSTNANHFISLKYTDEGGQNVEVSGRYRATNGYKTVSFIPEQVCGQNACGLEKHCLPFNAELTGLLETAELLRDDRATGIPGTGLVDTSGNALDGDSDGSATGAPAIGAEGAPYLADNFFWTFSTNDQIDVTPPVVVAVNPSGAPAQEGVVLDQSVEIQFSEEMSYGALSDELALHTEEDAPDIGYSTRMDEVEYAAGQFGTQVRIVPALPLIEDTYYSPRIPFTALDGAQNCFYPSVGPGCENADVNNPSCCASRAQGAQGVVGAGAGFCEDLLTE